MQEFLTTLYADVDTQWNVPPPVPFMAQLHNTDLTLSYKLAKALTH